MLRNVSSQKDTRKPTLTAVLLCSICLFLPQVSEANGIFGDGSDGPLVVTDTFHVPGEMNFTDVTIVSGGVMETHGFIVRVSGSLTNEGVITDSYSGGEGGAGGAGGIRGRGNNSHTPPTSGSSGAFGAAGAFIEAGAGGQGGGGGGGGGGAWDNTNNKHANGGNGGGGGKGGRGGGWVQVYANILVNHSVIHADGLASESGESGLLGSTLAYTVVIVNRDMAGGGGGGGGGGTGGNGGTVVVVYGILISPGTVSAFGGSSSGNSAGGLGLSAIFNAGANQKEENGASGGGSNGGKGGRSEKGKPGSDFGIGGGFGSVGASGNVTFEECITCYVDADGDGSGDESDIGFPQFGGTCPAGFVTDNTDCDDNNPAVFPNLPELPFCDGLDNNCNGVIDENATGVTVAYRDSDSDGFGDPSLTVQWCGSLPLPLGYVVNSADCNDSDPNVNPNSVEICDNGIDDNCTSLIDFDDPTCVGCCDTPADYNDDGSFNIADVTAGIARIFSGGAPPACQDEADANGDNAFNIADVTFGIARIFSSGPAPICGTTGM